MRLGKWSLRSIVFTVVAILLVTAGVVRGLQFMRSIGIGSKIGSGSQNKPKTVYTVALLGYGGGVHDGAYLTDTIIVARVDTEKNTVLMISVPRDLWISVPTKTKEPFFEKANALYQVNLFPSDFPNIASKYLTKDNNALLLKDSLKKVTGLQIDNYVAADFASFTKTIDLLGGIDITVDTAFIDPSYPIDGKENELCGKEEQFKQVEKYLKEPNQSEMDTLFKDKPELKQFFIDITDNPEQAFPCRYETLNFAKGPTHLTGEQALKFVRSRHSLQDGSDFGRASRQQKVIVGIKNKILSIGFIPQILPLMKELEGHIVTDFSYQDITKFMGELKDASKYRISRLVLTDKNYLTDDYSTGGQYILRPIAGDQQWGEIRTAIRNIITPPTPTPTGKTSR